MKPVVQKIKGKVWIHLNGRTHVLEEEAKNFGAAKIKKSGSGELHAPMPGKITKILKQVGDPVQVGEVVLMMEAMKMEYTLKADCSGSVSDLHCQVGDLVPLGKKLAHILLEEKNV
jgi:biotin carboxyl carrier protein